MCIRDSFFDPRGGGGPVPFVPPVNKALPECFGMVPPYAYWWPTAEATKRKPVPDCCLKTAYRPTILVADNQAVVPQNYEDNIGSDVGPIT